MGETLASAAAVFRAAFELAASLPVVALDLLVLAEADLALLVLAVDFLAAGSVITFPAPGVTVVVQTQLPLPAAHA